MLTPAQEALATAAASRKLQPRMAPAFLVMQGLLIHFMAKAGVPTAEIAARLDVNRSYVIRTTKVELKPTNAREEAIHAMASSSEFFTKFQAAGLRGLTGGADIETILAGGERPKLGPLSERRVAKAEKRIDETGAEKEAKAAAKAAKEAEKEAEKEAARLTTTGKVRKKLKVRPAGEATDSQPQPESKIKMSAKPPKGAKLDKDAPNTLAKLAKPKTSKTSKTSKTPKEKGTAIGRAVVAQMTETASADDLMEA